MKSYPFKKIDAFTMGTSAGNPAACIYLSKAADISEEEMQLIATELKGYVNEVVYLFPEKDGVYLRYYSSECEVDFCGHGTIAIMYDYIGSHSALADRNMVRIRVKDEYLDVFNRLTDEGSVYITSPEPRYNALNLSVNEMAAALDIKPGGIGSGWGPALINAGLNTLIVPICNLSACLEMKPGEMKLKGFCLDNGIDIVLVYTQKTAGRNNNFRTRVFAPKYGYLEDPATGSGNSAFGYYLLKHGAWEGGTLNIEQNNSVNNPNTIKLSAVKRDGGVRVLFGGAATVKIEGRYKLAAT
jgi:PhzF family phenazine biosynthesis protein